MKLCRTLAARAGALAVLLTASVAPAGFAQTTIDTRDAALPSNDANMGWRGEEYPGDADAGTAHSVGQTFTAPTADRVLNDFSFWLKAVPSDPFAGTLAYRAYVMRWDGTLARATGDVLFRSAIFSGTTNETYQQHTFRTGGILLDPGQVYVAFLSVLEEPYPGGFRFTHLAYQNKENAADTYTGGNFVAGTTRYFSELTTTSWDDPQGIDAEFVANFSAEQTAVVPEPMSMALLGTGLAGVAGAARRRRRKQEEEANA